VEEFVQLLKEHKLDQRVRDYLPNKGQSWELFTREHLIKNAPDGEGSQADEADAFGSLLELDEKRERAVLEGFHLVLEDLLLEISTSTYPPRPSLRRDGLGG
jgi:hypothetical protein